MKKLSTNFKYLTFIFAFVITAFGASHDAHAFFGNGTGTYAYDCGGGDYITSTVSISPAGPFQINSNTPINFTGSIASTCDGNTYSVKMTVQNPNGAVITTLIPAATIGPVNQYPFGGATFTSPAAPTVGIYNVIFTTGVNPTPTSTNGYTGGAFAHCFLADTLVTLANGVKENIQDVKIGDVLKGEKGNNTVLAFHRPTLDGSQVYSFNGGRYFVTEEHPFMTTEGWKSINPKKTTNENIGITVTDLKVGDTLVTDHGLVKLKSIDGKYEPQDTKLYNFVLTGDHTYYADGYLVHNKNACLADMPGNGCGAGYCINLQGQAYPPGGNNPITTATCSVGCGTPDVNPQATCATVPNPHGFSYPVYCAPDNMLHVCN